MRSNELCAPAEGRFSEIPKFDLARRRIEASGVSAALVASVADLFPRGRRDDVALLIAATDARCAACTGARS